MKTKINATCSFCNSENVIKSEQKCKTKIAGMKSVYCLSCGQTGFSRGNIKRVAKPKEFIGMRLKEALLRGLPVGTIVYIKGVSSSGIVVKDVYPNTSRHVAGKAVYFEKRNEYAMGWLDERIVFVELPKKTKKKG